MRLIGAVFMSLRASPALAGTFVVETNSDLVGQAPDWLDDAPVVWHDPLTRDKARDGTSQIHRSTFAGAGTVCLTRGLPGLNQVVRPDGSQRTNLTLSSELRDRFRVL